MESVKNIINDNRHRYEHLCYYELLIKKIENNLEPNPDIAIETCKTLIEGVSKFILKNIDNTITIKEINEMDFSPLFKKTLKKLSEYDEYIEDDFVKRAIALIEKLAEIRNNRGDISHGKLAPKEQVSSIQFSKLVKLTTEGVTAYLLDSFFSIDLSYKDDFNYGDNIEFNKMLDEVNTMPLISLSYSKALFDQEKETYRILLDDYNIENNPESE